MKQKNGKEDQGGNNITIQQKESGGSKVKGIFDDGCSKSPKSGIEKQKDVGSRTRSRNGRHQTILHKKTPPRISRGSLLCLLADGGKDHGIDIFRIKLHGIDPQIWIVWTIIEVGVLDREPRCVSVTYPLISQCREIHSFTPPKISSGFEARRDRSSCPVTGRSPTKLISRITWLVGGNPPGVCLFDGEQKDLEHGIAFLLWW